MIGAGPAVLCLASTLGWFSLSPVDETFEAKPVSVEVFEEPEWRLVSTNASCSPVVECDRWQWTDSLELFAGLEGSKQPQDFGVNAHFGGRVHANFGLPLWEESGLGLQLGTGLNQTDHAVAVTSAIEGSSSRTQSFSTVGIFQRTDNGWTWAIAHDFLYQEDYDRSTLTQWRGQVGYQLTPQNEIGLMGRLPQKEADANWGGVPVHLSALAQGSVYLRHKWAFGGETTGWLGVADRHGQSNVALGDRPSTSEVLVFGATLQIPLNDHWALFGEANFVTPADTGTVDAYLGFAFYPGGGATGWRNRKFSPILPVANNTSFTTNLGRR